MNTGFSRCKIMSEDTYNAMTGSQVDVLPGSCYGITSTSQDDSFWINSGVTKFTNMCTMDSFDTKFAGFLHYDLTAGSNNSFLWWTMLTLPPCRQNLTNDWKEIFSSSMWMAKTIMILPDSFT